MISSAATFDAYNTGLYTGSQRRPTKDPAARLTSTHALLSRAWADSITPPVQHQMPTSNRG
jgi:hypothetical protein